MSEDERDPTNEELRTALNSIAYNQTVRSKAKTIYDASERIYQLADIHRRVLTLRGQWQKHIDQMLEMKSCGDLTKDYGEDALRHYQTVTKELDRALEGFD